MEKKPSLYDHTGRPFPSDNPEKEDLSLPAGVQALIETRINAAISDIREHNRDDLQDLSRDHLKKWRFITFISLAFAVISSLITIVTTFYAPAQIAKWVTTQVDKKLTEPAIKVSADRVIEEKMSAYVDHQMTPLRDQATTLQSSLDSIRNDVENKQKALEQEQCELSKQLKISELAVAAKAGSRTAYTQLLALRKERDQPRNLLNASIKEIDLFYDADRNQLTYSVIVKAETLTDPGYSVDELVYIVRSDPNLAESAVNTLSKHKFKGCVQELCCLVEKTDDLRVAARATKALEEITGEKIRPLEFNKVSQWWKNNSTNALYHCCPNV